MAYFTVSLLTVVLLLLKSTVDYKNSDVETRQKRHLEVT